MFNSALFWGAILILLGISILLKTFLGITLPIIKPLIALFLIYFGVLLILDMQNQKITKKASSILNGDARTNILFAKQTLSIDQASKEYTIAFGKGILDFSNMNYPHEKVIVTINVNFGQGIITLNPAIPTRVKVQSNFASVSTPDNAVISFGSHTYNTSSQEPLLEIHLNVAFGNASVQL